MFEKRSHFEKNIDLEKEKQKIERILEEFHTLPVNKNTYKKVYDRLMWEKHLGNICANFEISLETQEQKKNSLVVILDSKI